MDDIFWETVDRIIYECERLRQKYKETGDKKYWRALVQMLPNSWMQKRTVTLNYQVARAQYFARRFHKLTEWHTLCEAYEALPYGKEFIAYEKPKTLDGLSTYVLEKLKIEIKNADGKMKDIKEIWNEVRKNFELKGE